MKICFKSMGGTHLKLNLEEIFQGLSRPVFRSSGPNEILLSPSRR
ncbi:hypothetical protein D4764_08G0007280 [Takifugu flavidus]|uniref:Uncharacterized protein n=1 Tax=Takifugu flavidus TaxID=433684 RepID=A0A5C6MRF6_9TELE|nr:hypothetical protein D4764_08G0007280 [Takifugu flavidus]